MAFLHFVFYLILYISALVANKRVHCMSRGGVISCSTEGSSRSVPYVVCVRCARDGLGRGSGAVDVVRACRHVCRVQRSRAGSVQRASRRARRRRLDRPAARRRHAPGAAAAALRAIPLRREETRIRSQPRRSAGAVFSPRPVSVVCTALFCAFRALTLLVGRQDTIRYDTIRDAILTCARKPA